MRRIFQIFLIFISLSHSIQVAALNTLVNTQFQSTRDHEVIVLIHGLMRSSLSMWPLKRFLENQQFKVFLYGYPSWKYSIQEHGVLLQNYIQHLIKQDPQIKIHFVTHSLGGIITREALSKLRQQQLRSIGYLIMLAPPNQGSVFAKVMNQLLPPIASLIKPMRELSSDKSSAVHSVPIPKIKMGIIAGRFDAKVPPLSAYLPSIEEFIVINSTHSFIMMNPNAMKLVLQFLEKGTFKINQKETAKTFIKKPFIMKQV